MAMFAGLALISGVYVLPLMRLPRIRLRSWCSGLPWGLSRSG